jgi:hypothetical protein
MRMVKNNLPPLIPHGCGLIPTRGRGPSLSSLTLSLSISLHLSLTSPHGCGSRRPAWSTRSAWPSTASRRGGSPSSARWPFLHHHDERRVGSSSSTKVAICFFAAGVSSHLRQAGPSHLLRHLLGRRPLGHLHRRHHHVQVSSPPPAQAPPSLSPTTHLCPHPLCEVS